MLIGAAAVISDYNGTAKASHIKDKLVEMAYLNENIAGTAMAASFQSNEMPAGNYQPNVLSENLITATSAIPVACRCSLCSVLSAL